ncbi:ATP-binding protein [Pseudarthrobacter sp. C4D7]|uniref:ATP-binding protein n=1 Tax=Pseudarthrobacter sp. C4D7 TaxID=2735268 RepID=UPI001584B38F|nr:ATP-binding protein [Pseudarthrobacter sp. C4D7]NUT72880.1 ATP-binding protein [Pseudarthrobacter sp. C4D7]
MTDVLASRSFRGPAAGDAIEAVHNDLDSLWLDVPFVSDMDKMTFTTAVIESASNIVQHAQPAGDRGVELGVETTVQQAMLQARVSAYHAKPPFGPMEPATPGEEAESGRGLALIEALVTTVTFERQDGTNTWVLSRTSSQDA